jgi:hypothetical protein
MTLAREQADADALRDACQQAIDCGDSYLAGYGLLVLGHLLAAQSDPGGAQAAYQLVIDFGDDTWSAQATAAINSTS